MANNKVVLSDGTTLMDITDTTAVASDVAEGKFFYGADGIKHEGNGKILRANITNCQLLFANNTRNEVVNDLLPFCNNVTFMMQMFQGSGGFNSRLVLHSNFSANGELVSNCDYMCYQVGSPYIDMSTVDFSNVTSFASAFYGCGSAVTIKLGNANNSFKNKTTSSMFHGCTSLMNLVLNHKPNTADMLYVTGSGMQGVPATCKIYVPDTLVNDYKSATNWSARADYIFPISEYVEV